METNIREAVERLGQLRSFVESECFAEGVKLPDCIAADWPPLSFIDFDDDSPRMRRFALRQIEQAADAIKNGLIAVYLESGQPIPPDLPICGDDD